MIIEHVAQSNGLPKQFVLGICKTESNLDRWAMRFEPDYRWLWDVHANRGYKARDQDMTLDRAPADFPASPGLTTHTEWIGQHTSYGVMQVMGSLAREFGFKGFFTQLCDVYTCCDIGCRYLVQLRDKYLHQYGWQGVASAYNAGSINLAAGGKFVNQAYPDAVEKNGGFLGL